MVAIPSAINIPLLLQDASDILLGALLQPTWGVYLNGMPVLSPAPYNGGGGFAGGLASFVQVAGTIGNVANTLFSGGGIASILNGTMPTPVVPAIASTVEFDYTQDNPIANYPQENGAFQSYNKTTLPWDVRLRVASGGNVTSRQSFLYTCQAIAASYQLFSVITPELVFSSCNCNHISWHRSARGGNTLIQVDLGFVQVPIVNATSYTNTAAPGDAAQQGVGTQQPWVSAAPGQVTASPLPPIPGTSVVPLYGSPN
jgi:hypothetical protein